MRNFNLVLGIGLVVGLAGCGDDGGTDGGGMVDSGGTDSARMDSGGTDSGGTDSGGTDSGGTDSGGTDGGGGAGDFSLVLTGYGPHVGQQLIVNVFDGATMVGTDTLTVMMAGTTVTIPDIIDNGTMYTVEWRADLDMDMMCDAPPTDHSWRRMGTGTATGLTIMHAHDLIWDNVCG